MKAGVSFEEFMDRLRADLAKPADADDGVERQTIERLLRILQKLETLEAKWR